jgi:arylformamidase
MQAQSPQWLDAMYNNRALVPDFARHFEAWKSQSAHVRQTQAAHLDLSYGTGINESLDIFPAASSQRASGKAPVLMFIHGGYWRSLDKADHSFIAPPFTQQGICTVIPNYALCPAVTVPDIALQMVQALAWVYRHIAAYGGDPERISVIGHSAGGHLAAMVLAAQWKKVGADLPADLVKAALSISGLFDLAPIQKTPFLKDDLRLTDAAVLQASPAYWPAPTHGTLFSAVGADESPEFIRQNQLIQKAWGRQAVPVCEALPGLNHFSVLSALCDAGHRLHELGQKVVKANS